VEEVREAFSNFDMQLLQEQEVKLQEGRCHLGIGSVVRLVGTKKEK